MPRAQGARPRLHIDESRVEARAERHHHQGIHTDLRGASVGSSVWWEYEQRSRRSEGCDLWPTLVVLARVAREGIVWPLRRVLQEDIALRWPRVGHRRPVEYAVEDEGRAEEQRSEHQTTKYGARGHSASGSACFSRSTRVEDTQDRTNDKTRGAHHDGAVLTVRPARGDRCARCEERFLPVANLLVEAKIEALVLCIKASVQRRRKRAVRCSRLASGHPSATPAGSLSAPSRHAHRTRGAQR